MQILGIITSFTYNKLGDVERPVKNLNEIGSPFIYMLLLHFKILEKMCINDFHLV